MSHKSNSGKLNKSSVRYRLQTSIGMMCVSLRKVFDVQYLQPFIILDKRSTEMSPLDTTVSRGTRFRKY